MIRSGIAPLDTRLGGVAPGRLHLLAGGVGTGKTTACLHFVAAGLEAGETAALLTLERPAELRSHAEYLGLDLATPLRERRLAVLRFRPEFARRLARAPSLEPLVAELAHALGRGTAPSRIAVDPLSPFLADGSPLGAGLAALVELLEGLGATALLTHTAPLAAGPDRRLDPLIERAAVIADLARGIEGGYAMRIARARLTGAPRGRLRFAIRRADGLVDGAGSSSGRERVLKPGAEHAPEPRLPVAERVRAGNGGSPS